MKTILMLMQQIEDNFPLSLEYESDCRNVWPNRWEALKKHVREMIKP